MPPFVPAQPTPPSLPYNTPRRIRFLGWLLVVLGPCLSVGITVIAYFLHQTIAQQAQPGQLARWNGSPEFTRTTFELFGAVFLFGVVALVTGVYQVRTGRRHPVLVALILLLIVVLVYFGYRITSLARPVT